MKTPDLETQVKNKQTAGEPDAYAGFAEGIIERAMPPEGELPNHSHEWRGTWNRPMKIDENTQHPLTVARMTDHNVKGTDETEK